MRGHVLMLQRSLHRQLDALLIPDPWDDSNLLVEIEDRFYDTHRLQEAMGHHVTEMAWTRIEAWHAQFSR